MLHKYRLGGITMADKQIQEAGDNSQQLQANTMILNIYNDGEKRAREICQKTAMLIKNYTDEALNTVNYRITELENRLI